MKERGKESHGVGAMSLSVDTTHRWEPAIEEALCGGSSHIELVKVILVCLPVIWCCVATNAFQISYPS